MAQVLGMIVATTRLLSIGLFAYEVSSQNRQVPDCDYILQVQTLFTLTLDSSQLTPRLSHSGSGFVAPPKS